jgi:hypothetical protein
MPKPIDVSDDEVRERRERIATDLEAFVAGVADQLAEEEAPLQWTPDQDVAEQSNKAIARHFTTLPDYVRRLPLTDPRLREVAGMYKRVDKAQAPQERKQWNTALWEELIRWFQNNGWVGPRKYPTPQDEILVLLECMLGNRYYDRLVPRVVRTKPIHEFRAKDLRRLAVELAGKQAEDRAGLCKLADQVGDDPPEGGTVHVGQILQHSHIAAHIKGEQETVATFHRAADRLDEFARVCEFPADMKILDFYLNISKEELQWMKEEIIAPVAMVMVEEGLSFAEFDEED